MRMKVAAALSAGADTATAEAAAEEVQAEAEAEEAATAKETKKKRFPAQFDANMYYFLIPSCIIFDLTYMYSTLKN